MSKATRPRRDWYALTGIIFSVFYLGTSVLLATAPGPNSSAAAVAAFYTNPGARNLVVVGAYLVPVAGIMFLWFMSVLRRRAGPIRTDSATFDLGVATGSGTVYVACLFIAAAAAATPAAGIAFQNAPRPSLASVLMFSEMSSLIQFAFGLRAAAAFLIFSGKLGLETHTMPRWLGFLGVGLGALLLVSISYSSAFILALPAWTTVASIDLFRRPVHAAGS